jgi:hypothetical protein
LGRAGHCLRAPLTRVWRPLVVLLLGVSRVLAAPLRLLHRLLLAPQLRAYARLETRAGAVRRPPLRTAAIRAVMTLGIVVTLLEASLLLVSVIVVFERAV